MKKTPLRRVGKNGRAIIPLKVRNEVKERSGGRCEFVWDGLRCVNDATEMHHVLPRVHGGKHTKENLRHTCYSCHSFCKEKPEIAIAKGFVKLMGAYK